MAMYVSAALSLAELAERVRTFKPDPGCPHDPFVVIALEEAIAAAEDGNFGVGACLVDPSGQVVERGHNHVFHPYPRSDLHAEMDTMTRFEDRMQGTGQHPRVHPVHLARAVPDVPDAPDYCGRG